MDIGLKQFYLHQFEDTVKMCSEIIQALPGGTTSKYIALHPEFYANALRLRAEAYMQLDQHEKAVSDLQAAFAQSVDHIPIRLR